MKHNQEISLRLADVFSVTPFSWVGYNPHYSPSNRESTEWMLNHDILPDDKHARLFASRIELLGAHVYPYADAEGLRIATDVLTILFTLDELTDAQGTKEAKETRDTFARALSGKFGDDISPITLFTQDFMNRLSCTSNELRERFVTHFIDYIEATAKEASLRATGELLTLQEHIKIRRDNGGLLPSFDIIEVVYGITLPAEVLEDNTFQSIVFAANDMISFSNDIYSYAVEVSNSLAGCNAITILIHNDGLSHQEAMDRVAELYKDCADTFLDCKASIRSFGAKVDEMVRMYIFGLEQWVSGHNVWELATRRFFGEDTEEVKRTGIAKVKLSTPS